MLGIDASFYYHIYIWLVTLLSLIVFSQYSVYSQLRLHKKKRENSFGVVMLTLIMVLFIGFRPISGKYFVDMSSYGAYYNILKGDFFSFNWNTENKLFDNYFHFLASKNVSVEFFFLSMAAIYFVGMAWACSQVFPRDKMAALLVYLGAFSTFSYGTNGIKAGAAASLFLVALAMREKKKWLWTVVFILLSWGFHHSMVLPIAAFIVCLFVKNPKWFFALWAFCFLMALFHVTAFQELFAGLSDEIGAGYLSGSEEHVRHDILGGFRIDFIIYSAFPIVFGWIAVFKKHIVSKKYMFVLNLYTLINSIWLLCMYANFTNRISYLSWLMLPIVLIYPFLKERWGGRQYKTFQWVAFGHLAFTLFMHYVYH